MRKSMKQRVALFLSFAMAFTSVDSSVLVAASDMTGTVSEEELNESVAEENQPVEDTAVVTEALMEGTEILETEGEDVIILDTEIENEGQITVDTNADGEEQILDGEQETDTELALGPETEPAPPETELVNAITSISVQPAKDTPYIIGLDESMFGGSHVSVTYEDGSTLNDHVWSNFWDSYGNHLQFYLRSTNNAELRYGVSDLDIPAGIYTLECEANGNIWYTDALYQWVELDSVTLQELGMGSTDIWMASNGSYSWYQFTAPEDGRYKISNIMNVDFFEKTDNGTERINRACDVQDNVEVAYFNAKAGTTYFLGFSGYSNDQTNETITIETIETKMIQSVSSVVPGTTEFISGLRFLIDAGTEVTFTYEDGTVDTLTLSGASDFADKYGNRVFVDAVKEGDEEGNRFGDKRNLEEGNYALEIGTDDVNGYYKKIYRSDYIFKVGNMQTISLPVLNEGENSIRSSKFWDNPCWYQFTSAEDGKYRVDNCAEFDLYQKTENGIEYVSTYGNSFKATTGTTYYLGFYHDVDGSYEFTVNIATALNIKVTDIIPGETESISGLTRVGKGTQFTVQYSDGTKERETVDGDCYEDEYQNNIYFRCKNKETGENYSLYGNKPEGDYALVFELDGEAIAETDYIYKVVSVEHADLPQLTVGTNHIISGKEECNWYKFKAPENAKYVIDNRYSFTIYEVTENGLDYVDGYYGWNATAGTTYCVGFVGGEYNYDTDSYEYEYDVKLLKVNKIESITDIVPKSTAVILELEANNLADGTNFTINYADGTSREAYVSGSFYYDNEGNVLDIYLKNKETEESYLSWSEAPEGNYALEFRYEDKVIATTDYVFVITSLEHAKFPELKLGENTITAGEDYRQKKWYKFTAPETGRYGFTKSSNMEVVHLTEDGVQSDADDGRFSAEEGVTYYIAFWNWYYDEEADENLVTWTTQLEKLPLVKQIKVVPAKTRFYNVLDVPYDRDYMQLDTVTFVYADGTSKDFTRIDNNSNIDGNGNGINFYVTSKKDDGAQYDRWTDLEPGEYIAHLQYNHNSEIETTYDITVEEEPTPFNGKATVTELELGKTYTVKLDDEILAGWFSYTPEEKITVTFSAAGNQYTFGSIYGDDGEVLETNRWGRDDNFIVSHTLEAKKTYYFNARLNEVGNSGTFTVSLKEKQSIQTLEVADHNLKPYYLKGIRSLRLNLLLEAFYEDGSSEVFGEYECDSYGNYVSREYLDASGNVTNDISNIGTYTCQIRYGEADNQVVEVGKFQVLLLADYAKMAVSDEEQELDATDDSVMRYQFTADEAGIYQLNSNVPFSRLKVYDEQQKAVKLSNHRNGYTGYVALQPGTYYVVADLSSLVTKLRVSVTKAVLPTKVTASINKTTLIAGVDRLGVTDLAAKLEYTDDTTGWIYGESADAYGNCVAYDITDGDDSWYVGETLPVGTYTVKPVVFRTGTYRWANSAVDNKALHEVLKEENINSLQIEVVKPDISSMTAIKENEYVEVSGNSRRQFFTFTPETDGTYTFEYDRERMGATVQFYKNLPKYLSSYGEVLDARAGQTYIVVADRYTDYQFRVVKQGTGTTVTKQIQQAEIIANKGYCTETSGYQVRSQLYLLVTYADGTTATLDVPWMIDGSSCDSSDNYGNTFKVDLDSFEEITKDDQDYLRVTVYCGDLTITKDIPYATIQEKAIEVTTKEAVTAEKSAYFKFVPEETGEYIFRTAASESVDIGDFEDGTQTYNRSGYGSENMVYEYANAYLKKGRTYYFDINLYRDNDVTSYTLTVTKVEKQVTDLKITGIPEGLVAYEGIGLTDYSWLQAEATYSDGTKETVTEERTSETGRGLSLYRTYWLNTKTYRVVVEYGKYRAHADFPAKAWDYTGEIKLGTAASAAGKTINLFSFTPDESGTYQFVIKGINQYGMEVYNSDTHQMIYSWYGIYDLEAGQKYDLAVYCYNDAETTFTITAYKEGEIPDEHEHEYVDQTKNATCTEPGYTQKVCSICGAVQEGSHTEIPATGHNLTATEAKEATCTEAGNKAYWTCQTCGKVYADENATTETTVKEQQIAAPGHRLVKTEAKETTCTEDGNKAYWTCQICEKVFADDQGTTETTVEEQVIAATGHKLTKTEAKEATCEEAGNHEYWTCETCEKVFSDAEGTIETTAKEQVIAALGHKLIKTEAKEATCEEAGNSEYWTCGTCRKVFSDAEGTTEVTAEEQVIAALGHKLIKTEAKEATCEEAGNNEYWTCETCGKVFADEDGKKATTTVAETISPLGHEWAVRVTRPATETEEGIQETYCTRCNAVQKTETIPMLGHRMGDWIITKEPTCTEEGSQYRECVYDKCTICTDGNRYRQEEVIPVTGHDLKMVDKKDATCTKAGNHAYWICQTCGKVYTDAEAKKGTTIRDQVIPATGHKYGEWQVTKDTKCEQAGEMTRICANCGNREKADILALGHNYVTERKEATCEDAGYEQERCSNCNQLKAGSHKRIPALGHSYGNWVTVKEVTCTDYGEKIKTCRRCGDVYRMIINITGHWYEEESKDATCTLDGYTQKKCKICGDVKDYEVIKALGHDLGEKIYTQEADCTTNGRYTQICKRCGETVSGQETMLGHDYREERKVATCTENGYTQLKCARCDAVKDYTLIAAAGHTFSEWETITPSTCKEKGTAERTCSNAGCGEKETKDLDLAEHSWESKIIEPATATKEGVQALICSVCGTEKEYSRTNIPMTAHQMSAWETVTEATCTTDGLQQRTCIYQDCTLCADGKRYTENRVIPALGHDLTDVEWVEEAPASCTKEGSRSKTCRRCKEKVQTEVIPVTAHDYVEQKKAPTCTTAGHSQLICTICHQVKESSFTSIPATGHAFGLEDGYWEYIVEPTCTDQGLIRYSCQNADCSVKRISVVPTVPHTWNTEPTVEKEATCVAEGLQNIHCQNCSAVKPGSTQTIDKTGHIWRTTKIVDQEATCTTEGQKSIHCSVCDAIKEDSIESIPAIGHRYGTSVETREATCTENGIQEQRCENCGEVVTVVEIEKLGHNMRLTDTMAATCEEDGVLTYTCSRCGRKQYKVQAALEHDWSKDTIIIDSTLDENGEEFQTCYRCGATNVVRVIPSKRQAEYLESINDYLEYGPTEADFQDVLGAMSQVDEEFVTSEQITGVERSMSAQTAPRLDGNMIDGATIVGGTLALASVLEKQENAQLMLPALEQTAGMPALLDSSEVKEQTGSYTLWIDAKEGGENPGEKYLDLSIALKVLQANGNTTEYTSVNTPIVFTLKLSDQFIRTNYKLVRVSEDARATEEVAFERNADGSVTFTTKNFAGLRIVQGDCVDGNHDIQGATETTTPATCTEPGKVTANCTVCGKEVLVKELAPLGHDYTVKGDLIPATCTENGTQTYICSHDGCTETRQVTVLATGHKYNWMAVEGEEATCEKAGREQQVCEKCDAVGESRSVDALGHEYGEWTVTTPATCKADGVETRSCKHAGCESKETRTIPKTNEHTFVKDDSVKTESINCFHVEQEKCSVCGLTKKVTTGEPDHDWGEEQTKDATCMKKGMVFKICKNCEETEIIKVLDIVEHKLAKTEAKAATCTEDGNSAYWTCETCGKVFKDENGTQETTVAEQITKATGHKLTKIGAKAATCTEDGNNAYWTCQTCKKVFADENGKNETTVAAQMIARSGHKLKQTPAKAATCVAEGTKEYWTCQTCKKVFADRNGKSETTVAARKLGKTAHKFGNYQITRQATVLAAGIKTRSCKVCGWKESGSIAKLRGTIRLTTKKLPLQMKKSVQLNRVVTGMGKGDYIARCVSSNVKVATVDNKGKVSGKATGTAEITVKLASGATDRLTIVVQKKAVATSSIANVQKTWNAKIGERKQLYPVISPITSTDKVTYVSTNKNVAAVSGNGLITAKKSGTAKITVKAGKKKFTVTVKVAKTAPKGMTGVPSAKSLKKKQSFVINTKLTPAGAEANIIYKSSNTKVATVNSKGKVTAKGTGTAVITVKAGNITKSCKITVK